MQHTLSKTISIAETFAKRPLIISGPCSAETEEQLLNTALLLKQTQRIDVLRAGIWKPRTRPGTFEGAGTKALAWLTKARQLTGLPVAVEVATAKQVHEVLQHGIDILWIGARTTASPFSVQELANALENVDVIVLIKNPINPDLDLWIGAVERIAKAGIKHIGLIHRGFSCYGHSEYRNPPMWHLAIEMKRRHPGIMMLNDPSHISGSRKLLLHVAQRAIDLGYDGLMLESHIDPDNALSDAQQQVTPHRLLEILKAIQWRCDNPDDKELATALSKLREQIDHVDDELLELLSHRMKIAEQIGGYKKEHNMTVLQENRFNEILERAIKQAEVLGLSREFIKKYFDTVHMESINHQTRVMNS